MSLQPLAIQAAGIEKMVADNFLDVSRCLPDDFSVSHILNLIPQTCRNVMWTHLTYPASSWASDIGLTDAAPVPILLE